MDWYLQIFQKPLNVKHTSGITVLSFSRKTSYNTNEKTIFMCKNIDNGEKGTKD